MKHALIRVVVVALAAAVIGGWVWTRTRTASTTGKGAPKGAATASAPGGKNAAPLKVSAVRVEPQPFAETVMSTGTLRAEEGVELQAEITGKIVSINFTEGSRVRKGDLLVKLNDADLRANLARATSRRELAKRREARVALLFKEGIENQDEYDSALNDVAVQEAEIALTEAQIAKTEIRAPFDGVVGLRFVSEGAYVGATTRIATLQRLDHLKVDFSVPERHAGRVTKGTPVAFTVAGGDQRYVGEVQATDPKIDTGTRSLLVRALCPNPEGRLLPGTFANVEITLSRLEAAILIPAVAVVPGVSDKNVFVASEGKVLRRVVETGTRTETTVQVLAGLKAGDVLITSGLQQMRAGLAVEPVFDVPVEVTGERRIAEPRPRGAVAPPAPSAATVVAGTGTTAPPDSGAAVGAAASSR